MPFPFVGGFNNWIIMTRREYLNHVGQGGHYGGLGDRQPPFINQYLLLVKWMMNANPTYRLLDDLGTLPYGPILDKSQQEIDGGYVTVYVIHRHSGTWTVRARNGRMVPVQESQAPDLGAPLMQALRLFCGCTKDVPGAPPCPGRHPNDQRCLHDYYLNVCHVSRVSFKYANLHTVMKKVWTEIANRVNKPLGRGPPVCVLLPALACGTCHLSELLHLMHCLHVLEIPLGTFDADGDGISWQLCYDPLEDTATLPPEERVWRWLMERDLEDCFLKLLTAPHRIGEGLNDRPEYEAPMTAAQEAYWRARMEPVTPRYMENMRTVMKPRSMQDDLVGPWYQKDLFCFSWSNFFPFHPFQNPTEQEVRRLYEALARLGDALVVLDFDLVHRTTRLKYVSIGTIRAVRAFYRFRRNNRFWLQTPANENPVARRLHF